MEQHREQCDGVYSILSTGRLYLAHMMSTVTHGNSRADLLPAVNSSLPPPASQRVSPNAAAAALARGRGRRPPWARQRAARGGTSGAQAGRGGGGRAQYWWARFFMRAVALPSNLGSMVCVTVAVEPTQKANRAASSSQHTASHIEPAAFHLLCSTY